MNNTNTGYIELTTECGTPLRAIVIDSGTPDVPSTIQFFDADAPSVKPVAEISQTLFIISFEKGVYKERFVLPDAPQSTSLNFVQAGKLYAWLDKGRDTLSPFIEQPLLGEKQRRKLLSMLISLAAKINTMPDKSYNVDVVKVRYIPLLILQITQGQKPSLAAIIAIENLINPEGDAEMWSTDMLAFLKEAGLQDVLKIVVSTMKQASEKESVAWITKAIQGGSPFTRYVWSDFNPFIFAEQYYRICPASMQKRLLCADPHIFEVMLHSGEIDVRALSYDDLMLFLSLADDPAEIAAKLNDVTTG